MSCMPVLAARWATGRDASVYSYKSTTWKAVGTCWSLDDDIDGALRLDAGPYLQTTMSEPKKRTLLSAAFSGGGASLACSRGFFSHAARVTAAARTSWMGSAARIMIGG